MPQNRSTLNFKAIRTQVLDCHNVVKEVIYEAGEHTSKNNEAPNILESFDSLSGSAYWIEHAVIFIESFFVCLKICLLIDFFFS